MQKIISEIVSEIKLKLLKRWTGHLSRRMDPFSRGRVRDLAVQWLGSPLQSAYILGSVTNIFLKYHPK